MSVKKALYDALDIVCRTGKPAQIKSKRLDVHNYILFDNNVSDKWICTPRDGFISKCGYYRIYSGWSYNFLLDYIK